MVWNGDLVDHIAQALHMYVGLLTDWTVTDWAATTHLYSQGKDPHKSVVSAPLHESGHLVWLVHAKSSACRSWSPFIICPVKDIVGLTSQRPVWWHTDCCVLVFRVYGHDLNFPSTHEWKEQKRTQWCNLNFRLCTFHKTSINLCGTTWIVNYDWFDLICLPEVHGERPFDLSMIWDCRTRLLICRIRSVWGNRAIPNQQDRFIPLHEQVLVEYRYEVSSSCDLTLGNLKPFIFNGIELGQRKRCEKFVWPNPATLKMIS